MADSENSNPDSVEQAGSASATNANERARAVEALLRERLRLDSELKEKYSREVTILFTDIKGSTSFFEKYGDLDGRQMLQQHNDLLFPLIRAHHGLVIKTIGDAIMGSFDNAGSAVLSAIEMQQMLQRHNHAKSTKEKIEIRIGLNTGIGIVEENDIFGDVVNLASRVVSQADAGQILISEETFQKVQQHSNIICRLHKKVNVKGKEDEVKLYRVIWGEEDLIIGKTRAQPLAYSEAIGKELVLDVEGDKGKIKISLSERTAKTESTLRQYVDRRVDEKAVNQLCGDMARLLQKATKQGKVSKAILTSLQECGQKLMVLLLTPNVIKQLREESAATNLLVRLNDQLVQVPWELLHTGDDFLCLKFNMGRVVSTRQTVSTRGTRKLEMPLRMLIIADPTGDLASAKAEGKELQELGKDAIEKINTVLVGGDASSQKLSDEICNFDLCHFAGHAVHDETNPANSRWLMKNSQLIAGSINGLGEKRPLPALIFSNACSSGQSGQWVIHEDYNRQVFGMANAFLLAGARHYIGSFWEVVDEFGRDFSMHFYEVLLTGAPIGQALRLARKKLIDQYGEDSIIWASYLLYGDPASIYFPHENVMRGKMDTVQAESTPSVGAAPPVVLKRPPLLWGAAAFGLVVLLLAAYGAFRPAEQPVLLPHVVVPVKFSVSFDETVALYKKGEYEQAIPFLQARIQEDASDRVAAAFLRESQRRLTQKKSGEQQQKIGDLARQLIEQHRAKAGEKTASEVDTWTSRPLTVALLEIEHKGEMVLPAGKEEYIPIGLGEGLQQQGRLRLVDRALLERVLRELQLGSSDLVNPATQLEVGRILAAKTFITGTVLGMDNQAQINLRIIDTETTEVIGQVRETFSHNDQMFDVVKRLANDAAARMLQSYPLRCRVLAKSQDGLLELNAGTNIGLEAGMKLADRYGTTVIEVVRVEESRAFAKGAILKPGAMLQK